MLINVFIFSIVCYFSLYLVEEEDEEEDEFIDRYNGLSITSPSPDLGSRSEDRDRDRDSFRSPTKRLPSQDEGNASGGGGAGRSWSPTRQSSVAGAPSAPVFRKLLTAMDSPADRMSMRMSVSGQ